MKKKLTPEEKKEIYKKWKELINMTPKELEDWGVNPERLLASINREEAKEAGGIQSGYDSFHRIKRRSRKKFEDWTEEDFRNAKQENAFNTRMLGVNPGKPVKDSKRSKWEISLRNWGHAPSKKDSPAYNKYQSWKKRYFKVAKILNVKEIFNDVDSSSWYSVALLFSDKVKNFVKNLGGKILEESKPSLNEDIFFSYIITLGDESKVNDLKIEMDQDCTDLRIFPLSNNKYVMTLVVNKGKK